MDNNCQVAFSTDGQLFHVSLELDGRGSGCQFSQRFSVRAGQQDQIFQIHVSVQKMEGYNKVTQLRITWDENNKTFWKSLDDKSHQYKMEKVSYCLGSVPQVYHGLQSHLTRLKKRYFSLNSYGYSPQTIFFSAWLAYFSLQ